MGLKALDLAQEAAALTVEGFDGVGGAYRELRDQATRAHAQGAIPCLGSRYQGHPRWLANDVSAREARVAVALALRLRVGHAAKLEAADGALDRVAAMTWRLMGR